VLKHYLYIAFIFITTTAMGQSVKMVHFDDVERLINRNTDTTYVINFWATWCNPCVHELPNFGKIDSQYNGKKVKVFLVSLDGPKDLDTKLVPFVERKHIKTDVWLLNAPDYNAWIDKVDPSWSGSIPATLVINNKSKKKEFKEKELSLEELNNMVSPFVNKSDNQ